jgi:glucose-1-phosphatase
VIRTVIFDLGNVIVPFDFKLGYARIAELCGCPASEIPLRIRATGLVQPFETGQVSAEEFVREVSAVLGLKATYSEFCEMWTSVFLPDTLIPESLLAGLRERHRLLLLSNTNPIHFSMIQSSYPLLGHFHDYLLSYEIGSAKPEAKIYQEALTRAACRPEECFFIDDMPINVEAARQHGMDAVQFQSAGQLENELGARGVVLNKTSMVKER